MLCSRFQRGLCGALRSRTSCSPKSHRGQCRAPAQGDEGTRETPWGPRRRCKPGGSQDGQTAPSPSGHPCAASWPRDPPEPAPHGPLPGGLGPPRGALRGTGSCVSWPGTPATGPSALPRRPPLASPPGHRSVSSGRVPGKTASVSAPKAWDVHSCQHQRESLPCDRHEGSQRGRHQTPAALGDAGGDGKGRVERRLSEISGLWLPGVAQGNCGGLTSRRVGVCGRAAGLGRPPCRRSCRHGVQSEAPAPLTRGRPASARENRYSRERSPFSAGLGDPAGTPVGRKRPHPALANPASPCEATAPHAGPPARAPADLPLAPSTRG